MVLREDVGQKGHKKVRDQKKKKGKTRKDKKGNHRNHTGTNMRKKQENMVNRWTSEDNSGKTKGNTGRNKGRHRSERTGERRTGREGETAVTAFGGPEGWWPEVRGQQQMGFQL